jgi:hypothetical protein
MRLFRSAFLLSPLFLVFIGQPVSGATLPSDTEVDGIVKACAGGRSEQFQAALEGKISLWKQQAQLSGKASKDDLGTLLNEVPKGQQISPDLYRTYTQCILDAISKFLADTERLRSDIRELANFPNIPENTRPPTLVQTLFTDQLPYRLFVLLAAYNKPQIQAVGTQGDALYQFKKKYYAFQSNVIAWENNLTTHIGELVKVRFREAWDIYLRYVILRATGWSQKQIEAQGDFLNYGITWDDAERVYTDLAKEPPFVTNMGYLLSAQHELGVEAKQATSNV